MNNINPIFEALSGADDRHIPVTQKKRPSKKLKIALIAAASAAALSLIVGSSMPRTKSYGKSEIYYGPSENDFVVLYPTPQKFTYPDYFVFEDWLCQGELETLDDVYEMFGITTIINDNFTVGESSYGQHHIFYAVFNTGVVQKLYLEYFLYDKNLGYTIRLVSEHFSDVNFVETGNGGNSYDNVEILTLKDGSQCVIIQDMARFVSEGVEYCIDLPYSEESSKSWEEINNDLKQVLADLGVL